MIKLLFLLAVSPVALANSSIASFDEAVSIAEKLEENETYKKHMYSDILPYFSHRYSTVIQSCFKSVESPDDSKFNIVLELNEVGKITKVFRNRETNTGICIINELEKDKFPAPLVSPFYINIAMSFK